MRATPNRATGYLTLGVSLPTVFVSHGAPTLALASGETGIFPERLSRELPCPEAVLCVSAHWETDVPMVSVAPHPETIHDFYGFPKPLYEIRFHARLRLRMSGSARAGIVALLAIAIAGCVAVDPIARNGGRPERIVLHYDFSGEWAATAGDECAPRLGLSDGVFIGIAANSNGAAGRFYVERFFMLGSGDRAQALVATMDADGTLPLAVETETMTDGRRMPVTYHLRLESLDASHVRLTGFHAIVKTQAGESSIDLLADAASGVGIPVLSAAGRRGLCLKRL